MEAFVLLPVDTITVPKTSEGLQNSHERQRSGSNFRTINRKGHFNFLSFSGSTLKTELRRLRSFESQRVAMSS